MRLEPLLQAIADFLDDQKEMIERVRSDLVRGLKKPGSGRRGLTPQQILRALVLMRGKTWDYRELRERIADGLMLRQFADFYCARVPKHDAFQRGFIRLTPQTLKPSMIWLFRRQSILDWRMARSCGSIPRSSKLTFITRPTTRYCGMWCASSHAWSDASARRWNCDISRVFAITRVRHGVGCTRSSG